VAAGAASGSRLSYEAVYHSVVTELGLTEEQDVSVQTTALNQVDDPGKVLLKADGEDSTNVEAGEPDLLLPVPGAVTGEAPASTTPQSAPCSSRSSRIYIYENSRDIDIYMRIQATTSHERALLSGGKQPFSGLLCSAGTALQVTRAHTIRRFCGAKEKEPRATRRGGPRCDWPNRYANQGRHLRSRKGHPRGGPEPLAGCPGLRRAGPIQGRAPSVREFTDPLGRKAHDVAARGTQVAAPWPGNCSTSW